MNLLIIFKKFRISFPDKPAVRKNAIKRILIVTVLI